MKLNADDLRAATLRRQFPRIRGRGTTALLDLFRRLGPIQSQVPRAPFLTAASRLPGTSYATITQAFEDHLLLKTSSLRGTVHTSTREHFSWLDAVGRHTIGGLTSKTLQLSRTSLDELADEIEDFCRADWKPRREIVARVLPWLADREQNSAIAGLSTTMVDGLIWGHSGLIRRPPDRVWEKRTDIYHRTATSLVPELEPSDPDQAVIELVRVHLRSYGPATRRDLAFFLGEGLTRIDRALATLGDEVVQARGPEQIDYWDLAEPPRGGSTDPGLRLLPEFDGLLLGFHGTGRTRFIDADQLPYVWAKINGLFSPVVLHQGRLVASWKTIVKGRRTDIEVQMLPGVSPLAEDLFIGPVGDLETALDLTVTDVRVRS